MATTDRNSEANLEMVYRYSHGNFQKLIQALERFAKASEATGLFSSVKKSVASEGLKIAIYDLRESLLKDIPTMPRSDAAMNAVLDEAMVRYRATYPNWSLAYQMWDWIK